MSEKQQSHKKGEKILFKHITYSINNKEKTAEIIGNDETNSDIIIIPKYIEYGDKKYVVKIIRKNAFKFIDQVKSIQFPVDSELKIIEKDAFFYSSIESITIPSSVEELEQGWNNGMNKLTEIKIMPNNPNYISLNDKIVLKKSSSEKVDFDVLFSSVKTITQIDIPKSIEIIGAYSFKQCSQLCQVNIPTDSKLRIIEQEAFGSTQIKSITIPPHLTKICESAFTDCFELENIEIPQNSELQTIEKYAFMNAPIKSLTIPSNLINLEKYWCLLTKSLTSINLMPNNPRYSKYEDKFIIGKSSPEKENFDVFVFCPRDATSIEIPDFIEIIASSAFEQCIKLTRVEISVNSKLRIIEKNAFAKTSIDKIFIPPQLTEIHSNAFDFCKRLQSIEISENSKLQKVKKKSFSDTSIESISIPSSLIDLEGGWCNHTPNLVKFDVNQKNKIYSKYNDKLLIGKSSIEKENFDVLVFCARDVKSIEIPDFIEIIASCAFNQCTNLHKVQFSSNSKLKLIENKAFNDSAIERIYIPPKVTKICEHSFDFCLKLERIEIPKNSELQIIDRFAFISCPFKSIFIPQYVNTINQHSFFFINNLLVEIDENSQLRYLSHHAFHVCRNAVIMIPSSLKDVLTLC